jgi:transcription antitermination protein NusB
MAGARRSGREAALQMLFQMEAGETGAEETIALFWRSFEADPEGKSYADEIVRGVSADREEIDKAIGAASENWRIERMTRLDRNLLRLSAWELMKRRDVPSPVILDESVELAKSFGTAESGAFVNGVLARVARDLGRENEKA